MENFNTLKPYLKKRNGEWYGGYGENANAPYKSFQTKYRNYIKKVCKAHGYELAKFLPGYFEFSCFVKGNDKYVYISISDVRFWGDGWYNNILIRTAEHDKDYTGGPNNHTTLPQLESKIVKMLGGTM